MANKERAVFLNEDSKCRYNVEIQTESAGPYFEGSIFRLPRLGEVRSLEGHFLVYHDYTNGNGELVIRPVGLAHS